MVGGGFRRLDAFVKTRPDLQQKSVMGGIITLVASTTAAILFLGQIIFYVMGNNSQHSLLLSQSVSLPLLPIPKEGTDGSVHNDPITQHLLAIRGKVPLKIHVTFPHLSCQQLDVSHDGASLRNGQLEKIHGRNVIRLRPPTPAEMKKTVGGRSHSAGGGCTVDGMLRLPIVAGVFSIAFSPQAWGEATRIISTLRVTGESDKIPEQLAKFNVSHYIHKFEFGKHFDGDYSKPLEDRPHMIENAFGGIAVESIQVKLVPTISRGIFFADKSYQASVIDHTIQPQTLVSAGVQYMPGLLLTYDFTPLTVYQSGGRDNIFVFLSSLISIVAGVFVTVGLVTGCLLHSASAVAKKID